MGKSTIYTISLVIFNSRLYVYQRVSPESLSIPHFSGGGNAATDSGTAGHTSAGIPRLSQVGVEDSHQCVSITHRIHVCYIYISIYGNIYHQYTPNVSIYTLHGSYG